MKPCNLRDLPLTMSLWSKEWNRLELRSGVLYRRRQERGASHYQLALPTTLRDMVLRSLHDDMGHLGIDRTLDLVRSRFFWPKMSQAVEERVKTCERCVRRKTPPERAAPLVNIQTSRPLELVCIDFLSLEPDQSNIKTYWLSRTTLQSMPLRYQLETKLPKPLLRACGTISWCTMDFRRNYIVTKGQTLSHTQ